MASFNSEHPHPSLPDPARDEDKRDPQVGVGPWRGPPPLSGSTQGGSPKPAETLPGMQDSLDHLADMARTGHRFERAALFWLHAATMHINFACGAANQLQAADWVNLRAERHALLNAARELVAKLDDGLAKL